MVGQSTQFLTDLLGKTLNVTIIDGRLFSGTFKCTDNEGNIVLACTMEYGEPTAKVESVIMDKLQHTEHPFVRANMIKRYLGLITVGRPMIVKIEIEERRTDLPVRPKP
jgi:N-alpha-acetyltransferase 38, NatC auxiliary subunit